MPSPWHSSLDPAQLASSLQAWHADHPNERLLALLAEADREQLPNLQTACLHQGIELAGGVFPRLISDQGFVDHGVMLLPCPYGSQSALLRIHTGQDPAQTAQHMSERITQMLAAWPADQGKPTLFMIFDGMLPDIASILDALYLQLADQVFYGGVNAGSAQFQPIPCLFDQYQSMMHGVLCLLLPATANPVINHGYPAPEHTLTATATAGNRIFQIDWRPAFEAYQQIVKQQFGAELNRDNFYTFGVHFPLGIMLANQQLLIRVPVALEDDGSVFCVGEVPENAVLMMVQAPPVPGDDCVQQVLGTLQQRHGSLQGKNLLSFYCAGRSQHFGPAALEEIHGLIRHSQAASVTGALTLGEIGSPHEWGYPLFHNACITASVWMDA